MSGSDRLWLRNGVFYYFRRVPSPLVNKLGKQHIKVSLRTKSKLEAKARRTIKDLEYDALFDKLRTDATDHEAASSSGSPTPDQILQYVRRFVADTDAKATVEFELDPPSVVQLIASSV